MELAPDGDLLDLVTEAAHELGAPGVAAGVLLGGRALSATVGVTSAAAPLPVDADTLFMIGSTSKTVTATALLALVDRGALSLADPVLRHVPDLRLADADVLRGVTVGHLLNHTSGWSGDLQAETGWGDDALARAVAALSDAAQEVPLGALASYSNSGFLLAGHVLARVHGTTFERAVHELVLDPLGLTASRYLPWEVAHRPHAVGHTVQDGRATPSSDFGLERSALPAGGLWSSLRDQLAWARYHLTGGTPGPPPLTEETRLRMQQQTVALRSGAEGIGLSWLLQRHGGTRLVAHGGNISNLFVSTFVLVPEQDAAVVVMANSRHGQALGDRVLRHVLQDRLGLPPAPHLAEVPTAPQELVGDYDRGPFGFRLTVDDGRLLVGMTLPADAPAEARAAFDVPPRALVAVGQDVFAWAEDPVSPVLDVRRGPDGAVVGIVHGLRYTPRSEVSSA